MQLYLVQAAFMSCVSVSGLWGLTHAHKASGVFISEIVVFGRWGLSSGSGESLKIWRLVTELKLT